LDYLFFFQIPAILFFASLIQSIIGFAYNMFAIPLLIFSGLTLAQAVALTSIPIFFQTATSTFKLKEHIVWKDTIKATIIRAFSIPLGFLILYKINSLDIDLVKKIVGYVLLVIVSFELFGKFKPKENLTLFWDIVTFGLSGFMLGMISMGGPPVAVWLLAHDWSALRQRAFLASLFFWLHLCRYRYCIISLALKWVMFLFGGYILPLL